MFGAVIMMNVALGVAPIHVESIERENVSMQKSLQASSWIAPDGKKMLFLQERYFVFNEDASLFDFGRIEYNEKKSSIKLINNLSFGVLAFSQDTDGKIQLQGTLYTAFSGGIDINIQINAIETMLKPPEPDSLFKAAWYGNASSVKKIFG